VLKDHRPVLANYEIYCDDNWFTHQVQVECTIGTDVKTLSVGVESRGVWRGLGGELRDLHGCDDIDLALTPATNTLPIGRLDIQVGSSESVIAAWVKFPELTIQPLSPSFAFVAIGVLRKPCVALRFPPRSWWTALMRDCRCVPGHAAARGIHDQGVGAEVLGRCNRIKRQPLSLAS